MTPNENKKLVVIQVAGLGHDFLTKHQSTTLAGLDFHPIDSVFPAVTCTAQASFRTASLPSAHGMTSNGVYNRQFRKPFFWEQSSALVSGQRIWQDFSASGKSVAMLFWQQSLGENVDIILSPAPIHKHHGGMIQDCYSQPAPLYQQLCHKIGRPFSLRHYWGPMASEKSSQWIAEATAHLLTDQALAPDLCLTYLPVLDYDLQRFGPDHPRALAALNSLKRQLALITTAAKTHGYQILVFGDYAIANCNLPAVYPNLALAEAGLLSLREINGMKYADIHTSRAFAMVDHEMAHVYVNNPADIPQTRDILQALDGIDQVMDQQDKDRAGINNPSSGELVLLANEGQWLAYPWWSKPSDAPDYASHVDIHNKPGYDPCELFWGWPPGSISTNPAKINGTHGRIGSQRKIAWSSTLSALADNEICSLVDLAQATASWLNGTQ